MAPGAGDKKGKGGKKADGKAQERLGETGGNGEKTTPERSGDKDNKSAGIGNKPQEKAFPNLSHACPYQEGKDRVRNESEVMQIMYQCIINVSVTERERGGQRLEGKISISPVV